MLKKPWYIDVLFKNVIIKRIAFIKTVNNLILLTCNSKDFTSHINLKIGYSNIMFSLIFEMRYYVRALTYCLEFNQNFSLNIASASEAKYTVCRVRMIKD